jgi:hypothetical protein
VSLVWACSAEDPLELHARYHIRILGILVGEIAAGVIGLESGSKDNGPHVQFQLLILLREIDCACGAELLASPAFALLKIDTVIFIDGILQRNGLCVLHVDGLARGQVLIVKIIHLFRTFFSACPAGNTFAHIHEPGMFQDAYLEIARFAADGTDFRQGQDFDVEMPADLDQFRRDNSHGTIIGGKCLVQLGHGPTNGRASFQQINGEP